MRNNYVKIENNIKITYDDSANKEYQCELKNGKSFNGYEYFTYPNYDGILLKFVNGEVVERIAKDDENKSIKYICQFKNGEPWEGEYYVPKENRESDMIMNFKNGIQISSTKPNKNLSNQIIKIKKLM